MYNTNLPNCLQCERVLVEREYDHCLWCGGIVPERLRLPAAEKERLRQQRRDERARVAAREREKRARDVPAWGGV